MHTYLNPLNFLMSFSIAPASNFWAILIYISLKICIYIFFMQLRPLRCSALLVLILEAEKKKMLYEYPEMYFEHL